MTLSGNKTIDDLISYMSGKMEFVPYDRFEYVEFVAGFSKIYKATWIDGSIIKWDNEKQDYSHSGKMIIALKELYNSENINSDELLNEV